VPTMVRPSAGTARASIGRDYTNAAGGSSTKSTEAAEAEPSGIGMYLPSAVATGAPSGPVTEASASTRRAVARVTRPEKR